MHYLSHLFSLFKDNTAAIFSLNNDQLITEICIERPVHSTNEANNLYIVSEISAEWNCERKILNNIKKGNYINVISKLNFNIINKIQYDNWFSPGSLYVSNDKNLYTTANELDENKIWFLLFYFSFLKSSKFKIKQNLK